MIMLKYCTLMGPTLGLYEKIMVKWKILKWDRYSWYQSNGLEVERVIDDEIVRLHVQTYDHS